MNGLFQAGAFFGTLIVPWIADKWGRKAALGLVS
jgi:MFS family permease